MIELCELTDLISIFVGTVDTYIFQTFAYLNKLSDVALFLTYSRNCFENPSIKEEELKKLMDGVPELVRTKELFRKDLLPEQIEELANIRCRGWLNGRSIPFELR